jgi:hypothetical protein
MTKAIGWIINIHLYPNGNNDSRATFAILAIAASTNAVSASTFLGNITSTAHMNLGTPTDTAVTSTGLAIIYNIDLISLPRGIFRTVNRCLHGNISDNTLCRNNCLPRKDYAN